MRRSSSLSLAARLPTIQPEHPWGRTIPNGWLEDPRSRQSGSRAAAKSARRPPRHLRSGGACGARGGVARPKAKGLVLRRAGSQDGVALPIHRDRIRLRRAPNDRWWNDGGDAQTGEPRRVQVGRRGDERRPDPGSSCSQMLGPLGLSARVPSASAPPPAHAYIGLQAPFECESEVATKFEKSAVARRGASEFPSWRERLDLLL